MVYNKLTFGGFLFLRKNDFENAIRTMQVPCINGVGIQFWLQFFLNKIKF
jgi:hypothetical protein